MKRFGQFEIKVKAQCFTGDKIKISKVLNKEIIVHAYHLEQSKVYKGQCLHLQISLAGEKHIIFTSATGIIEAIQQISPDDFPFTTVIVTEDERYIFT